MATIYDKVITLPASGFDRLCVLDVREALVYPSAYEDWNSLYFSCMLSATNNSNYNFDFDTIYGHGQGESIIMNSNRDRFFIGMKTNNATVPGEDNEPFIGVFATGSYGSSAQFINNYNGFSTPNMLVRDANTSTFSIGVLHANNTFEAAQQISPFYLPTPAFMAGTERTSLLHTFHLTVLNKGLPNQAINIKYLIPPDSNGQGTEKLTDAQLRVSMISASYTNIGTFNWNLAGTPYPLPTSLYLYFPFGNARLRVHHVGIIKDN